MMENELRNNLITTAAMLAAQKEMTEETIGLRAIKDNTFFKRMRGGAGFTIKTYDKLMTWMKEELARKDAPKPARVNREHAA